MCFIYLGAAEYSFTIREHTQHMFPYSLDSVCVVVRVAHVWSLPLWKEVKPIKIPTCIKKTVFQYTIVYIYAYNWMAMEVEIYGLFIFILMTFCFFGDKVLFYIYEFCI